MTYTPSGIDAHSLAAWKQTSSGPWVSGHLRSTLRPPAYIWPPCLSVNLEQYSKRPIAPIYSHGNNISTLNQLLLHWLARGKPLLRPSGSGASAFRVRYSDEAGALPPWHYHGYNAYQNQATQDNIYSDQWVPR
ncbi:hypothetical protein A7C99_0960 [Trichophyton rubrum]|uniref:Uncharacterized protein n=1 Tax=Trichophyton rubrum TaxID=5551 RepID=A0A178F670_TRIRU|nr:hypothetical protein A7C99_0960 [Trichophyton rubrum]